MYTSRAPRGLYAAWPALTGLLLMLSYPPYDLAVLAWFALVPLLWCAFADGEGRGRRRRLAGGMGRRYRVSPRREGLALWDRPVSLAFAGGLLWGVGLFYPLLLIREGTWVERAGGTAIIALLTATTLGLFYAAAVRSASLLPGRRWLSIPVFASLWVCLEYLIRAVAVGFSTYFGVTQWRVPALLGVASVGGVYAVSWLLVAANTAIAMLTFGLLQRLLGWAAPTSVRARGRRTRTSPWLPLALGLGTLAALWQGGQVGPLTSLTPPAGDARSLPGAGASSALRLVLIQPQITPEEYRQARSGIDAQRQLWQRVMAQSASALERLEQQGDAGAEVLVVLPETVVHYTAWDDPTFRVRFSQFARNEQTNWLIGLPRSAEMIDGPLGVDERALDLQHRNSVFFIDREGAGSVVYDKIYVIPVAESEFAPGRTTGVVEIGGHLLGVGICSDVVVPDHALATMRAGAGSLHYVASLGHIGGISRLERAFVVFRAAEHGVYVTQTATTGPTFAVDPRGRIVARGALGEADEVIVDIVPQTTGPTPYTRFGDWLVLASASIVLSHALFALAARRWPHRQSS